MAEAGELTGEPTHPATDVSVVLPAHRHDAYLVEAVRSVESALTKVAGELIVVANGPHRLEIEARVRSLATLHSTRVLVVAISSLGHSLNCGIEEATGEYIARMDADDVCPPHRFVRQLALARETGADLLFGAAELIDAHGKLLAQPPRPSRTGLWNTCGLIHPTAFMRRSALLALGGYGCFDIAEDYHLWLRAQAIGHHIVAHPSPVLFYRTHPDQLTAPHRLAELFATNAGTKLSQALRTRSPWLLAGAMADVARFTYQSCRTRFW